MKSRFISNLLVLSLIFSVGAAIALAVYSKIWVPFSNPWDIEGPLAVLRYNPNNDVLRFLIFVGLPSALLLVIGQNRAIRRFIIQPGAMDEPVDDLPGAGDTVVKVLIYANGSLYI